MKLCEAKERINELANIPIREYLKPSVFQDTML